jgi:hypothetical protein
MAKSAAAGDADRTSRPSLTLKRRLNAPPAKVYAAWTDPKKITRWFVSATVKAGSERAEIDARTGGRYRLSFYFARGLDMMNAAYHYLDLTPLGRNEEGSSHAMHWLRLRDEYQPAAGKAACCDS